jgi:hypothetical protein
VSGVFTHTRNQDRRLFLVVEPAQGNFEPMGITGVNIDQSTERDPILHAAVFRLTGSRIIIGLCAVDPSQLWIPRGLGGGEFWWIDQDIFFL